MISIMHTLEDRLAEMVGETPEKEKLQALLKKIDFSKLGEPA